MKIFFTFLLIILIEKNLCGQDLINSYLELQGTPSSSLGLNIEGNLYKVEENSTFYSGEYEILLDQSNPWGNQNCGISTAPFVFSNFYLSYQIELVSFPFSPDCAFPSSGDLDGGCDQPNERVLYVPPDSYIPSSQNDRWIYPVVGSSERTLWRITNSRSLDRLFSNQIALSDQSTRNTLASAVFVKNVGVTLGQAVLPHSILRHKVNIHCGNLVSSPIISTFTWYSDLTRGRMREYPFHFGTISSANLHAWDIITRPEFFNFGIYSSTDNSNCLFPRVSPIDYCNISSLINYEGCTINYSPFDPTTDDNCLFIPAAPDEFNAEYATNASSFNQIFGIPLPDYTLIGSSSPKNYNGTTLAGYEIDGNGILQLIDANTPIFHKYYVNNNISLTNINSVEKVIYNPSEVFITADDLKFPANYTFKTIRGIYPYASEVLAAENDPKNAGSFSDPYKRDVPVETDLFKDFHITDPRYPSNDHRYASIYHLETGSKLTIEPCVNILDATFEINPGSEIVFENWLTNQINVDRYQLLFEGGIVTKRVENKYFQNEAEARKILNWEAADFIAAGENVDNTQTTGEYSVEPGADVRFTATNYIELKPGFTAKYGGDFLASIDNVSLSGCPPMRIRNPHPENANEQLGFHNEIGYFTCSPNPASDKLYLMFEIKDLSTAKISIYNSIGELIDVIGKNSFLPPGKYSYPLPVSNLSAGLYIAKLQTAGSQKSLKFIKQ